MKTLRHLIHQNFIIGIQGTRLTPEECKLFSEENIGGVILFNRNIESPQQLHELIIQLQLLAAKSPDQKPLLVAMDMEGGRVQRLQQTPFTKWPSMQKIGLADSPSLAFDFALSLGKQIKAIGINTNLAPCLDVLTHPKNKVIGDRALSTKSEVVEKLGSAIVRGFIKSEIISCGKHFPGHGAVAEDSHQQMPIDESTLDTFEAIHWPPFKRAFRAKLPLLMTAHIKYSQIDPHWPATLSEKILREILYRQLGFRGLIMSDDLDMKALRNHWSVEEIAVQSVRAGCQLLLYGDGFKSLYLAGEALEKATLNDPDIQQRIIDNHQKIIELKNKTLIPFKPLTYKEALQAIRQANPQDNIIAIS